MRNIQTDAWPLPPAQHEHFSQRNFYLWPQNCTAALKIMDKPQKCFPEAFIHAAAHIMTGVSAAVWCKYQLSDVSCNGVTRRFNDCPCVLAFITRRGRDSGPDVWWSAGRRRARPTGSLERSIQPGGKDLRSAAVSAAAAPEAKRWKQTTRNHCSLMSIYTLHIKSASFHSHTRFAARFHSVSVGNATYWCIDRCVGLGKMERWKLETRVMTTESKKQNERKRKKKTHSSSVSKCLNIC